MDIFYHIVQNSTETLMSNLSKEMIKEVADFPVEFKSDIIGRIQRRREKVLIDKGWIYLCIVDNDIKNKYFKNST